MPDLPTTAALADGPVLDPAWTVSDLGLEDVVLSYMDRAAPDQPASGQPAAAGSEA